MARKICAGKEHTRKFNVIAIGESGLGKKTLLYEIFRPYCTDMTVTNTETQRSINLIARTAMKATGDSADYECSLFSTFNCYNYEESDKCGKEIDTICEFLLKEHIDWLKLRPELNDYQRRDMDRRIHCAFYFIAPHHLKPHDVTAIEKLSHLVPVIPIVARADSLTLSELEAYVQHVQRNLHFLSPISKNAETAPPPTCPQYAYEQSDVAADASDDNWAPASREASPMESYLISQLQDDRDCASGSNGSSGGSSDSCSIGTGSDHFCMYPQLDTSGEVRDTAGAAATDCDSIPDLDLRTCEAVGNALRGDTQQEWAASTQNTVNEGDGDSVSVFAVICSPTGKRVYPWGQSMGPQCKSSRLHSGFQAVQKLIMEGGHIEILIHRTDLLTTQLGLHEYQVSQEDSLHQPMPHPLDLPFVVRGKTKQKLVPSGVLLVLLLLTFVVCGWLVIAICVPLAQSLKMECSATTASTKAHLASCWYGTAAKSANACELVTA